MIKRGKPHPAYLELWQYHWILRYRFLEGIDSFLAKPMATWGVGQIWFRNLWVANVTISERKKA